MPGIGWPAIPDRLGASVLAMQYQLARSQWWPREVLEREQFRQLDAVLAHAVETVPFHARRLTEAGYAPREPVTRDLFANLPLTRRSDLQAMPELVLSTRVPVDHGSRREGYTSGSTSMPLKFEFTELSHFFWSALTLRDHRWHGRDFMRKCAVIRAQIEGGPLPGWGASVETAYATGPGASLNIRADIGEQLKWLQREQPAYLLTHPSNLRALALRALEERIDLPGLAEVRSFGEVIDPDLRDLCRRAWDVPLTDLYSAEEVGYIALQCPEHEHYHIQAENLIVEVLDDAGAPCAPGSIGRVVITTLHNFAMPLIRYDIGDYAEVGDACPCGRGLPVLERIMGRQRNMLHLPDGTSHWPYFAVATWALALPVRQFQLVQDAIDHVELRLVCGRALTAGENDHIVAALREAWGYPFRITVVQVASIERGPNAKYEEFVCRVS